VVPPAATPLGLRVPRDVGVQRQDSRERCLSSSPREESRSDHGIDVTAAAQPSEGGTKPSPHGATAGALAHAGCRIPPPHPPPMTQSIARLFSTLSRDTGLPAGRCADRSSASRRWMRLGHGIREALRDGRSGRTCEHRTMPGRRVVNLRSTGLEDGRLRMEEYVGPRRARLPAVTTPSAPMQGRTAGAPPGRAGLASGRAAGDANGSGRGGQSHAAGCARGLPDGAQSAVDGLVAVGSQCGDLGPGLRHTGTWSTVCRFGWPVRTGARVRRDQAGVMQIPAAGCNAGPSRSSEHRSPLAARAAAGRSAGERLVGGDQKSASTAELPGAANTWVHRAETRSSPGRWPNAGAEAAVPAVALRQCLGRVADGTGRSPIAAVEG